MQRGGVGGVPRVLVVDPDRARRTRRLAALARAGIAARGCAGLGSALRALATSPAPEVVETRLDLGPSAPAGGIEVFAAAAHAGVRRVYLVGRSRDPAAAVARRLGATFVRRPLPPAALVLPITCPPPAPP